MATFTLQRTQFLPRPRAAVFPFFADAANLEAITPPWLGFRILTPGPIVMGPGTLIDYRIRWRFVPLRWRTAITVWEPPVRFVDEQVRGPYRLWRHTHTFAEVSGGTAMTDVVEYALPLGPLGRLMHRFIVERDLAAIFDYRREQVLKLVEGTPP
jgi:ligand-binding SRPBCC domain-containing protein